MSNLYGSPANLYDPTLSTALRDAINEKVLDGLPLGKPFWDTPLSDLSKALLQRPLPD